MSIERSGLSAGIGIERVGGGFDARSVDLDAAIKRRLGGWTVRVSGYAGAAQTDVAAYARSFTRSSPQTASFTCSPRSATVIGQSQTASSPPHSLNLSLDLEQTTARGSVHAGGFATQLSDALVQADATSAFDAEYTAELAAANEVVCGAAARGSLQTLARRWESVPVLRQREWFVEGERHIGTVRLRAFIERFSDVVSVSPPGLALASSSLIPGAQVPHIAPLRGAFAASVPVGGATIALGARLFRQ